MPQPTRVQILTMSKALEEIGRLCDRDFKNNLLVISRLILEIELYIDQLKAIKLSREIRLTLNKFEKVFKELKVYLFLNHDIASFKERLEIGQIY